MNQPIFIPKSHDSFLNLYTTKVFHKIWARVRETEEREKWESACKEKARVSSILFFPSKIIILMGNNSFNYKIAFREKRPKFWR